MDASPGAMLKVLLPRTPFIFKTALWHALSLSETSAQWDLRTEVTVRVMRQMLGPGSGTRSITFQQKLTTRDPGVKGALWVSKVRFPLDGAEWDEQEGGLRWTLSKAIRDLGTGTDEYTPPPAIPLEGEWVGHRANAGANAPEPPELSESDKYANLVGETTSRVTTLYFHGGAMYLLDPATYRPTTSKIARTTGGRVFAVRYRLSPQNPFPAAILDALTAYLSLLYPPPGSPHAPVPAADVVFGGDSAGGMLCAALLQLLLQIRRSAAAAGRDPSVRFHGQAVDVPLPAGLALTSPWLDVTRSLPSVEGLAKYDYLPPPSVAKNTKYPPCEAWPANPPRADLYCDAGALLHPLASPLAARDWAGSPPVFFSVGQEMLRDEGAALASRLAAQAVPVVWREFEAMPHVFALMLDFLPAADLHFRDAADFCTRAVEARSGGDTGPGVLPSAELLRARTLERVPVDVAALAPGLGDDEVERRMREGRDRIVRKHAGGDASAEARPML